MDPKAQTAELECPDLGLVHIIPLDTRLLLPLNPGADGLMTVVGDTVLSHDGVVRLRPRLAWPETGIDYGLYKRVVVKQRIEGL